MTCQTLRAYRGPDASSACILISYFGSSLCRQVRAQKVSGKVPFPITLSSDTLASLFPPLNTDDPSQSLGNVGSCENVSKYLRIFSFERKHLKSQYGYHSEVAASIPSAQRSN